MYYLWSATWGIHSFLYFLFILPWIGHDRRLDIHCRLHVIFNGEFFPFFNAIFVFEWINHFIWYLNSPVDYGLYEIMIVFDFSFWCCGVQTLLSMSLNTGRWSICECWISDFTWNSVGQNIELFLVSSRTWFIIQTLRAGNLTKNGDWMSCELYPSIALSVMNWICNHIKRFGSNAIRSWSIRVRDHWCICMR